MMRGTRGRRLLLATFVGLVPVLLALPALSRPENDPDPRNNSRGESGANPDCIGCHRSWGMYDSHVVQTIFPREVRRGEPAEFKVRIDNAWTMEVRALRVSVALPGNGTGLLPLDGANVEPPWTAAIPLLEGNLTSPQARQTLGPSAGATSAEHRFEVGPDARRLEGRLALYPLDPLEDVAAQPVRVRAELVSPQGIRLGNWTPAEASSLARAAVVETPAEGTWKLRIAYENGQPPKLRYGFEARLDHGRPPTEFLLDVPEVRLGPREATEIPFRMVGEQAGVFDLEVKVRATLYYDHSSGGYDWDNYTRHRTVTLRVGDRFVAPDAVIAVGPGGGEAADVVMAEMVGLSSAVLLPPALLVGGTYGRASRQFFNRVLGGAKRRVTFHSAVSLGLTAAAVAHAGLFLLEGQYSVLKGMLWGGLGLVALLGLALTGYYQVPLIQRWGYDAWRRVHLVLGVLVVVFTAWHTVVDGADFGEVKERLPAWLTQWNLAEA